MKLEIKEIGGDHLDFLEEMLYEALFIPEGEPPLPRSIIDLPEIAKYVAGWGRPGDFGLIARGGGERIGAAWFRLFCHGERGYGYIDDSTPELTIAVRAEYRGLGIGASLLEKLILAARERGFDTLSLSVDSRNPACSLYRRMGFETVGGSELSLTMKKDLEGRALSGERNLPSLEESVAQAMDGSGAGIVPFLPYIFQDAWELGVIPEKVLGLVGRHARDHSRLRVLDLGCGKGAVSVKLAAEFGCRCLGIDAVEEFVDFAERKALEFGVSPLCLFVTGDIREKIGGLGRFDVIVLGAIGPVLGDYRKTLTALSPHLREGGIIVIDDGYIPDDSPQTHPLVLKRGEMLRQIRETGMHLAGEIPVSVGEIRRQNDELFRDLTKRCEELIERHPKKRELFEGYVRRQVEENDFLENRIVCAVMVIQRSGDPAGQVKGPAGRPRKPEGGF